MAQLRRDSLEYQKNPERVKALRDKVLNENVNNGSCEDEEIFGLQKTLLGYLRALAVNDTALQFSQRFLVGQWIKGKNYES